MLSIPEQLCMLRPQRVSFCYARQHTVNHQREVCSRSEVFLTNKAEQGWLRRSLTVRNITDAFLGDTSK